MSFTSDLSKPNSTIRYHRRSFQQYIFTEKKTESILPLKSSSTEHYEDESHTYTEVKVSGSTAVKRKRKKYQSSSSSIITTIKQSTRLAAKRVRVE
ncbi:unnamed protein product [Rotaria sp. Silwood2]|nr:unnamed protein product [Rotaria sp. Silwood2]